MECVGTALRLNDGSATFLWQRATPFIIRWFAGRTCNIKWYANPSEVLCDFYSMCIIYKRGRGLRNANWRASAWRSMLLIEPDTVSMQGPIEFLTCCMDYGGSLHCKPYKVQRGET